MRAHLLILKTLLIRRDLRNWLIKHAVQHHKCMPANNSSITSRYQFILKCVFPTRLCASGDVDVWRSNEQCITCCYNYVVPTTACHCGHVIATWPAIQVLYTSVTARLRGLAGADARARACVLSAVFMYSDQRPTLYVNWAAGEPAALQGGVVVLDGRWAVRDRNSLRLYVCQKPCSGQWKQRARPSFPLRTFTLTQNPISKP